MSKWMGLGFGDQKIFKNREKRENVCFLLIVAFLFRLSMEPSEWQRLGLGSWGGISEDTAGTEADPSPCPSTWIAMTPSPQRSAGRTTLGMESE